MKETIEEMNENVGKCAINIRSVQASNVYRVNHGYKRKLTEDEKTVYKEEKLLYGKAVISESLFARYARHHGVTVNGKNQSLDFVMMRFDHSAEADDSDKESVKPRVSVDNLRKLYYENGVTIVWRQYDKDGNEIEGKRNPVKYRMLYRNTGKAKEGYCVFCREELHEKLLKYLTMDLWNRIPNEVGAKIVELSAYAPLITATAMRYIHIPLNNIFVMKDEEVSCEKAAYIVRYTENKGCYVDRECKDAEVKNVLWDGMGIIDESLFPEDMDGFIYCRSHFFKSCLFRGNIQDYFRDYYKEKYEEAYATDMLGRKIKVSDIKVIVTDNSMKWLKFKENMSDSGSEKKAFHYYRKVMEDDGEIFEIVKTGHSSKYGNMQRSSFQMNNTLLTTDSEVLGRIVAPSIQYCNELKTNIEKYLEFLEATNTSYSINHVLIDLYRRNPEVELWSYFKKKRVEKISDFKRNRLQQGKLLQMGDNLTICGNVISLLKKVTRENFLEEKCFSVQDNVIQCYTERFPEGEELAGFRSPHNSPNNIICLKNVYPETLIKYFPKLGKNVIVINGIRTDVQERLNSQDLDSDTIYTTNQADIVELAKKAYREFPTIKNGIIPSPNLYNKSMASYAKMDSTISKNQLAIGTASNVAQLALSYWFDGGCKNKELEDVFIICAVLAQVAIDSAKRTFDADVPKELHRILKKDYMNPIKKYPRFYAEIEKYKNKKKKGEKKKIPEDRIGKLNCPMDIIYGLIEEGVIDLRKDKILNTPTETRINKFLDFKGGAGSANRSQRDKIIGIVKEYHKAVKDLDKTTESYKNERMAFFDTCRDKLKNLQVKEDTMKCLVKYAFEGKNTYIRDYLLVILYEKDRDLFLNCFHKKRDMNSGKICEK